MKNVKKKIAALMTAMALCSSIGMPNGMTAKAAEGMPMDARVWVHSDCGTPVEVSVEDRIRIISSEKCYDYRHSPECHVCVVEDLKITYITCPKCGITEEQDRKKIGIRSDVHLDW